MAENTQNCLFPSPRLPVSGKPLEDFGGYKTALALALLGAGAAALFILAHWSIALVGAVVVLVLSAVESEPFLLFIIFLIPLGLSLKTEGPLREVPSIVRSLVIVGFLLGRLWRGRVGARRMLSSSIARASLFFLGAIAVPIIFGWTNYSAHYLWAGSYIGFFFLVSAWADSPERVRKILRVLLYSTIITAVFAILQEVVVWYTSVWLYLYPRADYLEVWQWRATSFLRDPGSLADYLNLILPFALACYVLGQGKWKKLGGWTLGLGFVALLSTQSIGAPLAFVSILVLAIFCFARSGKKKLVLLAGLCALVCLFYLLRPILNPTHPEEAVGSDVVSRLLLWITAWGYFMHSPVFGVGLGNFVHLYGSDVIGSFMPPEIVEVHNIYLQLLAETGLVGFVAFFYLVVQSWRQARGQWRCSLDFLDRALAFGVLGALLSVLVHGFVGGILEGQIATLLWVLLALLVASGRLQRKSVVGRVGVSGAQALENGPRSSEGYRQA
jgi:O-antigen ligase